MLAKIKNLSCVTLCVVFYSSHKTGVRNRTSIIVLIVWRFWYVTAASLTMKVGHVWCGCKWDPSGFCFLHPDFLLQPCDTQSFLWHTFNHIFHLSVVTLHLVVYHKSLMCIDMSCSSFSSGIIFAIASQYEDVQECSLMQWFPLKSLSSPPPPLSHLSWVCFLLSFFLSCLLLYILEFFSPSPLLKYIFYLPSFFQGCFCPTFSWMHSLLLAHSSSCILS